jgi:hypothetical protein
MPLRDPFRPPPDDYASWEEFHGGWPMEIVRSLADKLPPNYVAGPHVHHGSFIEVDLAAFDRETPTPGRAPAAGDAGVAALWAPPQPSWAVESDLPATDEYEVRVYDVRRHRRLVSAVEIVSPANKDRPEHRRAFVAKCSALLQKNVSLSIVDLVTTRDFDLYAELMDWLGQSRSQKTGRFKPFASACRYISRNDRWHLESWENELQIGQPLPTLPLWLSADLSVPLDLEQSYEETCRLLRIA